MIRSRLTDGGGPEFEESVFLGNDVLTGIDAEANRLLREKTGAGVVDMESHVAAAYAQQWRLPFAAIRAISDTAHQEIPPAALVPLLEDGSGDWKGVLGSLIRQPGQLPELWEMVRGFDAAMTTLRATREVVDLSKLVPLPASGPCNASR